MLFDSSLINDLMVMFFFFYGLFVCLQVFNAFYLLCVTERIFFYKCIYCTNDF